MSKLQVAQNIVSWLSVIAVVVLVLLPFLKLANFSWYTPTCFYCSVVLLLLGAIVRVKITIFLAVGLFLWTFGAPFLLLLLPEIFFPE